MRLLQHTERNKLLYLPVNENKFSLDLQDNLKIYVCVGRILNWIKSASGDIGIVYFFYQ